MFDSSWLAEANPHPLCGVPVFWNLVWQSDQQSENLLEWHEHHDVLVAFCFFDLGGTVTTPRAHVPEGAVGALPLP